VKSRTTKQFRAAFDSLPPKIKRQAREAYRLFQQDPHHPGLHFKQIEDLEGIYSVRVGLRYRAVGTRNDDAIVWFWIGSHSDYDKLLSRL
jgi:mRNA-degrading endonuclease RelE of RelBE toxin-antitoxin system